MSDSRAIIVRDFGGPEVLKLESIHLQKPATGEVQVRQTAIGLNFIDVYQRKGLYKLALPTGLGHEAAGCVEAVGTAVTGIRPGDRVIYMNAGLGAYAERRNVAADKLAKIPNGISDEDAAAMFFKGMTAQYLLRKTHAVRAGEMVLIHAAAGGVGQILAQWAKALGAFVVGTAGSDEKCVIARAAGCDLAINYKDPDWATSLLNRTGGRKANVVYDSVGRDTFLHSLDLAAPFGLVVVYGAASGPAPAIEPELLNKKGCLFLTRPSVFPHNADLETFRANAAEVFEAIRSGYIKPRIGARFPLTEASQAHRLAEGRGSTGAIVLFP